MVLQCVPCQAPGVVGSALGLVVPVSVYFDRVSGGSARLAGLQRGPGRFNVPVFSLAGQRRFESGRHGKE